MEHACYLQRARVGFLHPCFVSLAAFRWWATPQLLLSPHSIVSCDTSLLLSDILVVQTSVQIVFDSKTANMPEPSLIPLSTPQFLPTGTTGAQGVSDPSGAYV